MCAQHMPRRDLNTLVDAALTTCTGSLFQALTTRIEKNFSLRVVEHLFFSVCSCVLSWYSPPFLQAELIPCTLHAFIYIPRSCPLSFDDMKVRGEQVSLVGWHNRNSSSQGPSSLLFFAHPLTILHHFHTLGMLLYYSILDVVSLVL